VKRDKSGVRGDGGKASNHNQPVGDGCGDFKVTRKVCGVAKG